MVCFCMVSTISNFQVLRSKEFFTNAEFAMILEIQVIYPFLNYFTTSPLNMFWESYLASPVPLYLQNALCSTIQLFVITLLKGGRFFFYSIYHLCVWFCYLFTDKSLASIWTPSHHYSWLQRHTSYCDYWTPAARGKGKSSRTCSSVKLIIILVMLPEFYFSSLIGEGMLGLNIYKAKFPSR